MLGLKEVNWGDKYLATGDLMGKDDDGSEKKFNAARVAGLRGLSVSTARSSPDGWLPTARGTRRAAPGETRPLAALVPPCQR